MGIQSFEKYAIHVSIIVHNVYIYHDIPKLNNGMTFAFINT